MLMIMQLRGKKVEVEYEYEKALTQTGVEGGHTSTSR